jgi:hypothetical protein
MGFAVFAAEASLPPSLAADVALPGSLPSLLPEVPLQLMNRKVAMIKR